MNTDPPSLALLLRLLRALAEADATRTTENPLGRLQGAPVDRNEPN
jgi:hypothetical protein